MRSRYDWETIRAEYEAGGTMGELSRRHGVTKAAISQRAKREGWLQDISGVVDRLTEAKVNGILNTVNPQKKAEALSKAADAKAAVIVRHQAEWEQHKTLVNDALASGDFDAAKLAKITAETLKIRQEGERKAWGIVDKSVLDMTSSNSAMKSGPSVVVDLSGMSSGDVAALARAAFKGE